MYQWRTWRQHNNDIFGRRLGPDIILHELYVDGQAKTSLEILKNWDELPIPERYTIMLGEYPLQPSYTSWREARRKMIELYEALVIIGVY